MDEDKQRLATVIKLTVDSFEFQKWSVSQMEHLAQLVVEYKIFENQIEQKAFVVKELSHENSG